MHELFVDPSKITVQIASSSYLIIRRRSPRIQVIIHDEIERFGVEQLLRSRGANILTSSRSSYELPHSKSELIILAARNSSNADSGQFELIKSIPRYAENARLLIICPGYFQPLAQAAIDSTQIAAHFLIRTEQEITDQLLRATRLELLGK